MPEVWDEIEVLWREVKEYKWDCDNIPPADQQKLSNMVRLYKQQFPKAYMSTAACKLAATITQVGRVLHGQGRIEEWEIYKRTA